MNPLRRYIQYIVGRWRLAARQAALYRVHLEVSRWFGSNGVWGGWVLVEKPWRPAWSADPLLTASAFFPDQGGPDTVVYVSGRSPFQGGVHGLAFKEYGIAIVDSLNPGTIAHELGHLMGRDHSAKGSSDIMDDMWPYQAFPNIPWRA